MKKSSFIIAVITLGAAGFFASTLVHAVAYTPGSGAGIGTTTPASGNYPSRLVIPSLSINANVQYTTITKRGTMGTPTNFTDVAWYGYGVAPGSPGEAVIDGHVNNGLGLAGVFTNLDDIKNNDDIFVVEKDGTKLHFVVTNITSYGYENIPMQNILSSSGAPRLALITCEGNWISGQKTYDQRLVVTATLVNAVK